jgi:hypothetical protein
MTRAKYKALRVKAYKMTGEIGHLAELHGNEMPQLESSYKEMCRGLDAIDDLGISLGYVDPETNDLIDRRFKNKAG